MHRIPTTLAITLALGLAATPSGAAERCKAPVEGRSRVQHALTPATDGATAASIKRSYDHALEIGRRQAIKDWTAKAVAACAGSRGNWSTALQRSVGECDRAMGGRFTVCARAIPR